jgi:hypothetical protein
MTFVIFYALGIWTYVGGILAGPTISYTGYDGPVLVSADGRTLTVGNKAGVGCGASAALIAEQTATRVALRVKATIDPPGLFRPDRSGACAAPRLTHLDVELNQPLGTRALVDGATGRVLPTFDGRTMLRPRWLPMGYALWYNSPDFDDPSGRYAFPVACAQWFRSGANVVLVIYQLIGQYPFPGSSPIYVRGHAGQAGSNSITWFESGQTYEIQGELPVADLIAVADSAP